MLQAGDKLARLADALVHRGGHKITATERKLLVQHAAAWRAASAQTAGEVRP
jgi:hypothetical protein